MSEPKPNLPLLRRVLKQIDAEPKRWNQLYWATETPNCGTAFCIGGWACELDGQNILFGYNESSEAKASFVSSDDEDTDGSELIKEAAERILGLNSDESYRLFKPNNFREDVEQIAHEIAARAGEPLWPETEAPA